jgi:predicted O-methyltransferase YrrM
MRPTFVLAFVAAGAVILGALTGVLSASGEVWIHVLVGVVLGAVVGAGVALMTATLMQRIRVAIEDASESAARGTRRALREELRDVRALINIRAMTREIPLPFDRYTITPALGEMLGQLILDVRPDLVLECGSGTSTLLMASYLRMTGRGRVVALEHDARFAARTRQLLRELDLEEQAQIRDAPLRPVQVGERTIPWYDLGSLREVEGAKARILFVDGPPGRGAELARLPALPLLLPYLAEDCIVILDDAQRPDETLIAERWARETGASLEEALQGSRRVMKLVLKGTPGVQPR